jgi:hypothetical protein
MRLKSFAIFVFHQFVGTYGIAILANICLTLFFGILPNIAGWSPSMHFVHWVLTENPFYPAQILAGPYFGWLLGRHFPSASMLWIWILPLGLLAYAFAITPRLSPLSSILMRPESIRERLEFYFGWNCQPRDRCIDQLLVTMPFYASVAYSIGALLARHLPTKARRDLDSGNEQTA